MAKAKAKNPKLSESQYWHWRTLIAELWNSENKLSAKKCELECLNKDAIIGQMRAHIFKLSDVAVMTKEKDKCQGAYQSYKEELEAELGVSLSGTVIDDVTLEIKQLDD